MILKNIELFVKNVSRNLKGYIGYIIWENYGGKNNEERKSWHVDHINPQCNFPYDSLEHPNFLKCWSLNNLRPLEKIENLRKNKYVK